MGSYRGFWQILSADGEEEIVPLMGTTTAVRPSQGFALYTAGHFIILRTEGKRRPPSDWPPPRQDLVDMFRAFYAIGGRCRWQEGPEGWTAEHEITAAADPRLRGTTLTYRLAFDGEHAVCRTPAVSERWRRLSGPGTSPLAGAWESVTAQDRWLYLTSAGHYAVMRTDLVRPESSHSWDEMTDDAIYALSQSFGANAGARLETDGSFDHWPMLSQVAGYDVRKHPTFRLTCVENRRFVASLPPLDLSDGEWYRLE